MRKVLEAVIAAAISLGSETSTIDGAFVWRIEEGGVERVPVVIGKRDGDDVYIEAALADGELVAVESDGPDHDGAQLLDQALHLGGGKIVVLDDQYAQPVQHPLHL